MGDVFPRQPHPSQLRPAQAGFAAPSSRSCLLGESPTGTGKTLDVIAAACRWLAWLGERRPATGAPDASWLGEALQGSRMEAREAQLARVSQYVAWGRSQARYLARDQMPAFLGLPDRQGPAGFSCDDPEATEALSGRVVYSSRTHSQLEQFTRELRARPASARRSCVTLASRERLCVHARAGEVEDPEDFCRQARDGSGVCRNTPARSLPASRTSSG